MKSYDKKVEEINTVLEGIFSKLGSTLKGLGKGLTRQSWSDKDQEEENVPTGKELKNYVANQGSKEMNDSLAGDVKFYLIGDNKVLEVEDSIYPYLYFERRSDGVEVSNQEKTLKVNPGIDWLYEGVYTCKFLSLGVFKAFGDNGIKGKMVRFDGFWKGGVFKGYLERNGIIYGNSQIVDGIFSANEDGFQMKPWNFISGGYVFNKTTENIMGLPIAEINTQYKNLSLVQITAKKSIVIKDNNDDEHIFKIEKSIDLNSLNFKINGIDVSWNNYAFSKANFLKTFLVVGKNFSIPGVDEQITKGIQSIEVKDFNYIPKQQTNPITLPIIPVSKSKTLMKGWNKFDVNTKMKGWNPSVKDGYRLDVDSTEEDIIKRIERFKKDINNGNFFKYANFFKRLIDEGRIDGYGKFLNLASIFPKQIGVQYKNEDIQRDTTMKYFNEFVADVINRLAAQNVSNYYLNKFKELFKTEEVVTPTIINPKVKNKINPVNPVETPIKKTTRATGSGISESFSIADILKKVL